MFFRRLRRRIRRRRGVSRRRRMSRRRRVRVGLGGTMFTP